MSIKDMTGWISFPTLPEGHRLYTIELEAEQPKADLGVGQGLNDRGLPSPPF